MRNDQANLEDPFSSLAKVGTLGNVDERPLEALLRATGAAGGDLERACNAGFLRDDALLVVTIITDEEDERSSGDPLSWKRAADHEARQRARDRGARSAGRRRGPRRAARRPV